MPYLGQRPSKGDENNFKILDDISSYTLTFDGSDSSVVSAANDTITSLTHRFVQGQRVTYTDGDGSAIAGLTDATVYFIIKEDHNTIKLATSASNAANGTAVNITNVGSGSSHTLNVAFDGVNTKFKATHTNGQKAKITRSAQLVISINGVIQQPHDTASPTTGFGFDLDGTIVFSQAPVSSDIFWAHVLTNNNVTFDISDNDIDNFTGDGSTVAFNLSKTPPDNRNILVTVDGVVQYPNDPDGTVRSYNVVENVLTFAVAPLLDVQIQVRHIGFAGSTSGGGGGVTNFYGRTGSVVLKNTDNITVNDAAITGDATVTGNLTVNGTTTTLDTKLVEVDKIEVETESTNVAIAVTHNGSGDLIRLYDGASQVVTVDDEGKVGLGSAIPSERLDLVGNIKVSGTSRLSGDVTINRTTGLLNSKLSITKDADEQGIGVQLNQASGITTSFTTFNSAGTNIFDLAHDTDITPDLIIKLKHSSDSAPVEKVRITSAGRVQVKNGTINLGTADTSSGHINSAEVLTFNIDTDNDDTNRYFAFYKNGSDGSGTELVRIKEDGNVGIGTDNPGYKLELHALGGSTNLKIGSRMTDSDYGIAFGYFDESAGKHGFGIDRKHGGTTTSNGFVFRADTGRVGIGTDSPTDILDVYSVTDPTIRSRSGSSTVGANIEVCGGSSNDSQLILSSGTTSKYQFFRDGSQSDDLRIYDSTNSLDIMRYRHGGYLHFGVNGEERLRISSSGGVGINTTYTGIGTGTTKLAIQSTAASGAGTSTAVRIGNNMNALTHYPANLEIRTTGVENYNAIRTDAGDGNGGFTCGVEGYNGFLDLTTGGTKVINVKLRSSGMSYFNGGKVGIGTNIPYATLLTVGHPDGVAAGSVFTSAPLNVFAAGNLGGTAGDAHKIAIFGGRSTGNASGLSIYHYRRENGTSWTTDGFSFRQEVDNTSNIYEYLNFSHNRIGFGEASPSKKFSYTYTEGANFSSTNAVYEFLLWNKANISSYPTCGSSIQLRAGNTSAGGGNITGVRRGPANQGDLAFSTTDVSGNPVERLRIDSNGRILIGHSSTPQAALSVAIVGSYGGSATNTPFVYLCRDEDATSIGGNESLGQILFASKDGYRGAVIEANAAGAWSGSSSDGYLVFKTTPDNDTVPEERLRIHSGGMVEPNSSFGDTYSTTTSINPHIRVRNQQGADDIYGGIQLRADRNNGAAAIFNIACLNSSTNYASTLVFQSRRTDGNFSEKVRITSDNVPTLLIGQTTAHDDANGWTLRGDIHSSSCKFTSTDVRTMMDYSSYYSTGSQESKVSIHSTGMINSRYGTSLVLYSCERRTKKNIVDLDKTKAWNTLRDTPMYSWNYKKEAEGTKKHYGPIVDECPEDIIIPGLEEDEEGIINTVDSDKLQFRAYTALSEALKRIETLEAKVSALEGS